MQTRTTAILATAAAAAGIAAVLALRPAPDAGVPAAPPTPQVTQAAPAPAAAMAASKGGWMDPAMLAGGAGQAADAPAPEKKFYGRNGRPVDFAGKDAAAYIAERAARARTGDLKAAYEAYQAASGCAAAEEPLPEFFNEAEGREAARERERMRKLCANVSPAQIQERMRFLGQAADAGNRDAQIDFYMEGPGGRTVDLQARADDPEVRQWKQQAIGYLQQAGAQCDQFALGLLSNVYDAGQLVPRDPASSMMYTIASNNARSRPLSEDQLRRRFGDELAPAAFDAALQAGTRLAAASCPRG
jgi:hypothetical protein